MTPIKDIDPTVREYIVTVFTENQVGVLSRITSIFTRRKLNIESLKVNETAVKGISMFTIHAFTSEDTVSKIVNAVERIIEVLQAESHRTEDLTIQQIALYKVSSELFVKGGDVCLKQHNARVIEISSAYVILERTGSKDEVNSLHTFLQNSGMLLQFTRPEDIILHDATLENALNGIPMGSDYLGG